MTKAGSVKEAEILQIVRAPQVQTAGAHSTQRKGNLLQVLAPKTPLPPAAL